jgi:hypothetical protein
MLFKVIVVAFLCVLTVGLICCGLNSYRDESKLAVFKGEYIDDFLVLSHEGIVYHVYVGIGNNSNLIGDKIATIDDGYKNSDAVFAVKGYPQDQWVILRISNIMSAYVLYKADGVEDIPEAFSKLYEEYYAE